MGKKLSFNQLGKESKEIAIEDILNKYRYKIDKYIDKLTTNAILSAAKRNNIDMAKDSIFYYRDNYYPLLTIITNMIGHKSLIPIKFRIPHIKIRTEGTKINQCIITKLSDKITFSEDITNANKVRILKDFNTFLIALRKVYIKYATTFLEDDIKVKRYIKDNNILFSKKDGYMTKLEETQEKKHMIEAIKKREEMELKKEIAKSKQQIMNEYFKANFIIISQPIIMNKITKDINDTIKSIAKWRINKQGIKKLLLSDNKLRLKVRNIIDEKKYYRYNLAVKYKENDIWSKIRIINDVTTIKQKGMAKLSDYLYMFTVLNTNTKTHIWKGAWVLNHRTIEEYKNVINQTNLQNKEPDIKDTLLSITQILN